MRTRRRNGGQSNSSEDLESILNIGGENMNASETQQDLDSSDKSGVCRKARFIKESIAIDKPAEIVNLAYLDGSLERNNIKAEQNGTPEVPGVKALGQNEKLHSRESCLEAQPADDSMLQEEELGAFEVAEIIFGFNRDKNKEKGHVMNTAFSGQLLESWKKDSCPSLPLISEAKDDQEGTFSVHSFSQQTRWAANKLLERTCSKDCISGQGDKDLVLTLEGNVRKGNVSVASEEDFSCSPVMGEANTDEANCKKETALLFESVPKLCTNKNVTKPCCVLLKNISHEIKEKHEVCSVQPNVKKLPQKTQSQRKTDVLKKLKVTLNDLMQRSKIEKLKKPLQMQNAETLLGDAKENQKENSLEQNNSANTLRGRRCSGEAGNVETTADFVGKKTESEACSPDISILCDMGIFAKLSVTESNYGNSTMSPCHMQDNLKGKGSVPLDSVLIPEAQQTFFSEAKFTNISLRRTGTSLPGEADLCEAACESESCFASLRSRDDLGIKDTVPGKTQIKTSIEPSSMNSSTEEGIQKQVEVTEVEKLNQSSPTFKNINDGDCWFLMEIDEVIQVADPACVTDKENLSREPDCDDVPLSHGVGLPLLESDCESHPDDAAKIKYMIKKGRMVSDHSEACDGEISGSEESVNPPLSGPVGEEESLQSHQSHGVQMAFYELCGLTVKLLGTPSDNHEMPSLGRLTDLEDASSDEESQGKHAGLSVNNRKERKTYPVGTVWAKTLSVGDSRAKKTGKRTAPPVNCSRLSQSQSRTKVVDVLRETLQKRLDDSPDLSVQKNTVMKIAERVERALFSLFCCVDQHYKNKYRSLLFNLKSPDNQLLFRRVILGDLTPERLVQMTSLEMAPKELAEWRASENKRVLEIIEREEQEAPRCFPTKFTHKGLVEIHREVDEDLTFQETLGSQPLNSSCERCHPTRDSDCLTCAEQEVVNSERGFMPRPYKNPLKQKENISKRFHPDSMCLDGEERPSQEGSAVSTSIPKKRQWMEKPSGSTVVWEGLIQMFSLKQFAAKAYSVSGSSGHLSQDLPLLLQSRGCVLPEDVWVYLDSIWPANSKAMGVIRFCPSLTKGLNPYNMLYNYLNNKQRYGIVDTNQMEMYMVPLAAFQPVPSKLHSLGGPGLDLCHPSLLLGLILPKRTPTSILVTRPNPLPKAKRKRVTFKNSAETSCFGLPVCPQVDTSPTTRPPRLLCESKGPREPFSVSNLLPLPEELSGVTCHEGSSGVTCHEGVMSCLAEHREDPADNTNQALLDSLLQTLNGSPWTGGQALGTLGAQPHQTRDQVHFCVDSDPSHAWSTLGLLSPSKSLCPNPRGVDEANVSDAWQAQGKLCAEAVPPGSLSHPIPCTKSVAEAPNSLMEETLALIQHVAQLQSHLQSCQPLLPAPVSLPTTPQEVSCALSPALAGFEFPPVQQDNGMYAQLQLLLSTLGGQTQPPSAI